jgi:hypothetical protein
MKVRKKFLIAKDLECVSQYILRICNGFQFTDGFIILRHMMGFPASASDEDMINATRTRDEMTIIW